MDPTLIPRLHVQYGVSDLVRGLAGVARPPLSRIRLLGLEQPALPMSSGRAGLQLILQAMNLRPGARVGVPLYCCPTVFEAIARAGYEPVFVDVEPDGYNMSPVALRGRLARGPEVQAAVVVHLFGLPADVIELQGAARGLPIIEDCAHALGARLGGHAVGATGVGGFCSFGRGKWPAAGGGAAWANDPELSGRLAELHRALPQQGAFAQVRRALRATMIGALYRRPWYGLFSLALAERLDSRLDLRGLGGCEVGRMDATDLAILAGRLPRADKELDRRRTHARVVLEMLRTVPVGLPTPLSNSDPSWYLLPLRFRSAEERADAQAWLRRHHVDSMDYLASVATIARDRFGYTGDCPNAERAAACTLVVPHYHTLSALDVERIGGAVRGYWEGRALGHKSGVPQEGASEV